MIIEMVTFEKPDGFDDADLLADARSTVAHWQANPDLIRKHFVKGEDGTVAGLYIWPDRDAARRAHDADWIARFTDRTGRVPTFRYFDLFMVIDNQTNEVSEFPITDSAGPG